MSTQPQPDPGPHLRHNSQQQLPVRPTSNSDVLVSPSSTMQDYQHLHRTAPEDSHSLQHQRQTPTTMNTTIPSTQFGIDPRENVRRGVGFDSTGNFGQALNSREERPRPPYHGDSGFTSGETDMSPPIPSEWKTAFGSSGESATSGVGDGPEGASGENDRGSSGSGSGTHKSAPEDWFNAFNRDVGGNNYTTFDGTYPPPPFFPSKCVLARSKIC